jgi:glyoxylase-like metal-dependent hydrolase (beta-lactamase superfamily II)
MEQQELRPGILHLRGGSNMGLVVRDGTGLLIDAGLDKDAARQALRAVEAAGVTLEAVFLTHAHADHFGGAHFLQRRLAVPLYAPALEAAMMEHPIMEPLFLFAGAAPIAELRRKFTLAQPIRIDQVVEPGRLDLGLFRVEVVPLAGHAPNQMGLAVDDVLFCADAMFPAEALRRHPIPFLVDLDQALDTLQRLPGLPYACFAPGHGPAYPSGEPIERACTAHRQRLQEIRDRVRTALAEPQETASLIQATADHFGLRLQEPTMLFLVRTTILAALSSLEHAGEATAVVEDNRLLWQHA